MTAEYTVRNAAYDLQKTYYTTYVMQGDAMNGRNHYVSEDGEKALFFNTCGRWTTNTVSRRYLRTRTISMRDTAKFLHAAKRSGCFALNPIHHLGIKFLVM